MRIIKSITILFLAVTSTAAAEMSFVQVPDDSSDFVLSESRQPFVPWGFNDDLDGDGKTPKEPRKAKKVPGKMKLSWLQLIQEQTPQVSSPFHNVTCEGVYKGHLQGICVDENAIYWSFTTTLVKTDLDGKKLKELAVANHHGDLCHLDGKLYVAANFGGFNNPEGKADSWVYVYDADTLQEIARHEIQEVFHGAGGVGYRDGHFFVVGGLPDGIEENYVYEYDGDFSFLKKHVIKSGHTVVGIQTVTFAHDRWWFGCYGDPKILLVTDDSFQMVRRYKFDCSLGIEGLPAGQLLSATGNCRKDKGCTGSIQVVIPDEKSGLRIDRP